MTSTELESNTGPEIEICDLNDQDLSVLAKKTCILITTVGPYGLYGEYVRSRLKMHLCAAATPPPPLSLSLPSFLSY